MSDTDPMRSRPPKSAEGDATAAYQPCDAASELVRVLDQYLLDMQAGCAPERAKLLAEHPGLAPQLEQCLAGMEFIHRASRPGPEAPTQLGDFRILREVGRGGMGVVYEAEQVSLKRKVALKVLRFGGVADQDAMERFQREAETVARMHHTNIVPIFAIGEQQGVFYYAMQFIEGQSLAAVLQQSQKADAPLDPICAARWGVQAAEALAHAHQRNVIHRDMKPSNLILDPDGQIWLTDFGLAKRIDDVTLSMTGALLGTPRYMSPEQASAAKLPVDQRTDIYSLGATLYELATGKPVFEAGTPAGVITQILTAEPQPPRRVRPNLPRDLETIILKCIAKEPAQRYQTAQALADDLRSFAEGRAIKARRPRLIERTVRWLRKQRRSVAMAVAAALVAVLLAAGAVFGWSYHRQSQLGYLTLTTGEMVLDAEVLDEGGHAVEHFKVPHESPVPLPAGSYDVRLSAPGLPSVTCQLLLDRGTRQSFHVGLSERRFSQPILVETGLDEIVDLDGRPDVIAATLGGLRRINGVTGKAIWDVSLDAKDQPATGTTRNDLRRALSSGSSDARDRPILVQPAPDLNGDGTRDLVWVSQPRTSDPFLLAVSGKDGKVLWCFRGAAPVAAGAGATKRQPILNENVVIGQPAVADVDGDGVPDLVHTFVASATVASLEDLASPQWVHRPPRWVEAISGRTGRSLWRYALDDAWFPLYRYRTNDRWVQDASEAPSAAEVVRMGGRSVVVCVAGTRLVGLDLKTGKPAWPAHDIGLRLVRPPQFADLDGDGQAEILLLGERPAGGLVLAALSLKSRTPIWQTTLAENWPPASNTRQRMRPWHWPLVTDLDGDGKPEVIVPILPDSTGVADPLGGGVSVLAGATGQSRWQRRLRVWRVMGPYRDEFISLSDGPDLDGDGHRELFVATMVDLSRGRATLSGPMPRYVFVDAISGKDGHTLWSWQSEAGVGNFRTSTGGDLPPFGPLRWWPAAGADGWPQLLVPTESALSFPSSSSIAILEGGTGRRARIQNAFDPRVADFDRDGIPDLAFRRGGPGTLESLKLYTVRGLPAEAWRRLGNWEPAQDFDGDGIPDLVNCYVDMSPGYDWRQQRTAAISGRDGRLLWRTELPLRGSGRGGLSWQVSAPLPDGDLDGDGTADLVVTAHSSQRSSRRASTVDVPLFLHAVSGKTGRRLWTAEDLRVDLNESEQGRNITVDPDFLMLRDLDGDGSPEVVMLYKLSRASSQQWCVAVFSGSDGKMIWDQPLGLKDPNWANYKREPSIGDLDGDGAADLVLPIPVAAEKKDGAWWGYELRALSGRDGKLLWRRPLPVQVENYNLRNALSVPAVGDLDGDGKPEVVVSFHTWNFENGKEKATVVTHLLAFRGPSGEPIWTWKQPRSDASAFQAEAMALLAKIDGSGRHAVCVRMIPEGSIVLLDAGGRIRERVEAPRGGGKVLAFDVDGDGREELIFAGEGKLRATRGGLEHVLWERPEIDEVREILPGGKGRPATVVARWGFSVFGLDAATGTTLWGSGAVSHGERRSHRGGTGVTLEYFGDIGDQGDLLKAILPAADPADLPRLVSQPYGKDSHRGFHPSDATVCRPSDATVCRLTLPTTPAGQYLPPTGSPMTYEPPPRDPRWARPLPWTTQPRLMSLLFFGQASLIVLVFPGLLVYWAVRRRSWKLGVLPALYIGLLCWGIYLFVANSPEGPPNEWIWFFGSHSYSRPLATLLPVVFALVGLPNVVPWMLLIAWLRRRRWQRIGLLLAASIAAAAAIAVPFLRYDGQQMDPWEYYSWPGWLALWFLGAYATGALILAWVVLKTLYRWLRRGVHNVRRRASC